jgi:hypothetical protein
MNGGMVVAVARKGDGLEIIAKTGNTPADILPQLTGVGAKESIMKALTSGQAVDVGGPHQGVQRLHASARRLRRRPRRRCDRRRPRAVAGRPQVAHLAEPRRARARPHARRHLRVPARRLHLAPRRGDGGGPARDHERQARISASRSSTPSYGGLVFRLNSLLNQLFGVQEDETDDQGRPSRAPSSARRSRTRSPSTRGWRPLRRAPTLASQKALREEPEDKYYGRIFEEYVAGKRSLGDPVDHITREAFIARIMGERSRDGAEARPPCALQGRGPRQRGRPPRRPPRLSAAPPRAGRSATLALPRAT